MVPAPLAEKSTPASNMSRFSDSNKPSVMPTLNPVKHQTTVGEGKAQLGDKCQADDDSDQGAKKSKKRVKEK